MKLTRRNALQLIGSTAPMLAAGGALAQTAATGIDITPGRYTNTRESLRSYTIPEWFADAKFGIWSHWGPQSAVGEGDWYARRMYIEGEPQYDYHVKRFGPQSKVGYKDLIPLFTADRWDPEQLMDLYAKAGAKYFFSMGVHHDNFDMWNSKYQPRWNAVAAGPQQGHRRSVGGGGAQAGLAFRRQRASVQQLQTGLPRPIWPTPGASMRAFPMTAPTSPSPTCITTIARSRPISRKRRRPWAAWHPIAGSCTISAASRI